MAFIPFGHFFFLKPKCRERRRGSEWANLSEMCAPVNGRPSVEGVLHGEVSRVRGALKEGAQGTDISIPARPVQREAAGQDLLARKARLYTHRHCSNKKNDKTKRYYLRRKGKEKVWVLFCPGCSGGASVAGTRHPDCCVSSFCLTTQSGAAGARAGVKLEKRRAGAKTRTGLLDQDSLLLPLAEP